MSHVQADGVGGVEVAGASWGEHAAMSLAVFMLLSVDSQLSMAQAPVLTAELLINSASLAVASDIRLLVVKAARLPCASLLPPPFPHLHGSTLMAPHASRTRQLGPTPDTRTKVPGRRAHSDHSKCQKQKLGVRSSPQKVFAALGFEPRLADDSRHIGIDRHYVTSESAVINPYTKPQFDANLRKTTHI